jgi:WD40 repeat protein
MKNKKKSPAIFILLFSAIVILMFVANRNNTIISEFEAPREGIRKMYTVGKQLIAITLSNKICVWNWGSSKREYDFSTPDSKDVLYLPLDKIVYVPANNKSQVNIMNPVNSQNNTVATFPYGWQAEVLSLSTNNNYIGVSITSKTTRENNCLGIARISLASPEIEHDTVIFEGKFVYSNVYGLAISDDGNFAAFVGDKDGKAWLAIVDISKKKIITEHIIETSTDFTCTRFLKDSNLFYASGEGRLLYCFDASTGNLVKKLQMDEHSGGKFNEQRVSSIVVSSGGKLLAACITPAKLVYIWDTSTDKLMGRVEGSLGLSLISFSPDSSQYVISGNNYTDNLEVYPLPE